MLKKKEVVREIPKKRNKRVVNKPKARRLLEKKHRSFPQTQPQQFAEQQYIPFTPPNRQFSSKHKTSNLLKTFSLIHQQE